MPAYGKSIVHRVSRPNLKRLWIYSCSCRSDYLYPELSVNAAPVIKYCDTSKNGFISAAELSGKDSMCVYVYGNSERTVLCAVYDNLGKGASGAAIQNMNIIMNEDETKGLIL